MSSYLKISHPHQLDHVNSFKDLIATLNQSIRVIKNYGATVKYDGVSIPVRLKDVNSSEWVMDRGSFHEKDIKGTTLSNLKLYYKSHGLLLKGTENLLDTLNRSRFDNILDKLGLKTNLSRFFVFEFISGKTNVIEYDKEFFVFLGLYNFCESSKKRNANARRKGFLTSIKGEVCRKIKIDKEDYNKISNIIGCKVPEKKYFQNEASIEDFIKKIKKENLVIKVKGLNHEINIEKVLSKNNKIDKRYGIKFYNKIVTNKESISNFTENIESGLASTYITIKFGDYILELLGLKNSEGVILEDCVFSLKPIKFVGSFIQRHSESLFNQKKEKEKITYEPILPISF